MRMSCRFASLDKAEGFVEGLEYVNDSAISNIQVSYDFEWTVKFEDDDITEDELTYIYVQETDDEMFPDDYVSYKTRNAIADLEELYEEEENV